MAISNYNLNKSHTTQALVKTGRMEQPQVQNRGSIIDRATWSDSFGLAKGLNHRSKKKYNVFYDNNGGRSVNKNVKLDTEIFEMPKKYEFESW